VTSEPTPPKAPTPPRAVVWDIGNVLIEWNPERFYDRRYGAAHRRALFAAVDLYGMNLAVDAGRDWEQAVRACAAENPGWAEEILHWHASWLEMASPAIEASVRLLRALRARGVPCLALTNFGRETFAHALPHYPFLGEFEQSFVSGRLGLLKPDPRIYEALEQGTGLAGADLLFVDDRDENIAAAAARGWRVHLFRGPEGWTDRLAAEGLLDGVAA
jgi:2-haloacid dehalogenase